MNGSGIRPIEYNVLVRQDSIEEKTKGGLYRPDDVVDRDKHSQTRGTIIDVSPMAFAFEDWPENEPKPKAGDRVAFARHAGTFITGADGVEYRVVKDKDVVAVMEQ